MKPSSSMAISLCHDLELVYLRRRIDFITKLDQMIKDDAWYDDFEGLANDFKDVEKPSDLVSRLKELYGNAIK